MRGVSAEQAAASFAAGRRRKIRPTDTADDCVFRLLDGHACRRSLPEVAAGCREAATSGTAEFLLQVRLQSRSQVHLLLAGQREVHMWPSSRRDAYRAGIIYCNTQVLHWSVVTA